MPDSLSPGPCVVIVMPTTEDEAGAAWADGVALQWAEELSDPREDIYMLEDGESL